MKKPGKALSRRVKALRKQAGLSQQELATRADLSLSQVAKLEQGSKADPRASTLLALARGLGVRPGEMLDELLPAGEPEAAEPAPAPEENGHSPEDNGVSGPMQEQSAPRGKGKKDRARKGKKHKQKQK